MILVWLAFQILGTKSLAQQAQPNLTGKWKLNTERSKSTTWFGLELHDVLEIEHSGLKLKMRHPTSTLHGETTSYLIDGKDAWRTSQQRAW
jgi:hypothetical protein